MRTTGYPDGRPGYLVDHIVPLKASRSHARQQSTLFGLQLQLPTAASI
jgi:hypothetical protein